jgi:hypothetical protein
MKTSKKLKNNFWLLWKDPEKKKEFLKNRNPSGCNYITDLKFRSDPFYNVEGIKEEKVYRDRKNTHCGVQVGNNA